MYETKKPVGTLVGLLLATACGAGADETTLDVGTTEQALTTTLIDEGWELGWILPPWWAWGPTYASLLSNNSGLFGAALNDSSSLTRTVDTTGLFDVTLTYARRTVGFDSGEFLYAEWLPPGASTWVVLEQTAETSWGTASFALPGAEAGPISVRFRTNANRSWERADIDDILLTGEDAPPVACDDGVQNGDESDVDCGGSCAACPDGSTCTVGTDCESGLCDEGTCAAPDTTPLLVVLMDFADTDLSSILPDPEAAWGDLMFGSSQAEANHYFAEISGGQFQLEPAAESYGNADNGVVHVQIADAHPTGSTRYVIENQSWIPDALDLAASDVDFASYDTNSDGTVDNSELSVLFVLNIDFQNVSGAGAQANIRLGHAIGGTGPVIDKFARTQWDYTSIGVNVHELGHHIFGLGHFGAPTDHGLMGLGAYAEDPVITRLHDSSRWGTRPTHMTGWNKYLAGFVTPTAITGTTYGVELRSHDSGRYNVVTLPVVDGLVYLENRTRAGYDESIAFCGHDGGLFTTEVSQYVQSINIPGIVPRRDTFEYDIPPEDICDHYALAGHNDSFSYGGFTITNVSIAGTTMTFDVIDEGVTPTIQNYKFRYWIDDLARPGYRLWHIVTAEDGVTTQIDASTFPFGDDASRIFPISLDSYFDTGERRSVNLNATWSTSSSYLRINKVPIGGGPGTTRGDAIIQLSFDPGAPYESSAVVNVSYGSFNTSFELVNLPSY